MNVEAIPEKLGLVITIGMQKGGVAKTTNATHLAAALGERGRRVLLWDVDENHGATNLFQIPPDGFFTTWNVFLGDAGVIDAVLEADDNELDVTLPTNVDFIPSSRDLANIDVALSAKDRLYNPNEIMREPIREIRALGRYDYIILDTGPTASPAIRGALMTSDYYVLSCIPEKPCIDALPDAFEDIANARRTDRNPNLFVIGLILSCMDRRKNLAKLYEKLIAEKVVSDDNQQVKFSSTIGSAAAIAAAIQEGKTLLQYEPNHKVAHQYRELAEEFEHRVANHLLKKGGGLFPAEEEHRESVNG